MDRPDDGLRSEWCPVVTLIEANRLLSFGMVVLIWLVQVVIYPAFAEIAFERFTRWHAGYTRAVTWIVIRAIAP